MASLGSAHILGVAHEDQAHFPFAGQAPQFGQVAALVDAVQVWQTLGSNPQRVADRHADALLAEVQGEDAGGGGHGGNFIIVGARAG